MAHFLLGYTAKVAGTEKGVTEPQATFSACFGAPFMALPPTTYAGLLREKISQHQVNCWLVNTGWSGGPYAVGRRMPIAYTRALVDAALHGTLEGVTYEREPFFGLQVPASCPGVPSEILRPRGTWADGAAYDTKAREVAMLFWTKFQPFAGDVEREVRDALPKG
jgi:phosphoenolpyruvate carboxykinase (ATP)